MARGNKNGDHLAGAAVLNSRMAENISSFSVLN